MIFGNIKHSNDLYNILLKLSRNKFFYNNINLPDTFETRIHLMFIHFSLILIVFKKKGENFNQREYDSLFHSIENNLRELGFGDVSVNEKMKNLNKILYDILLKIEKKASKNTLEIEPALILKYFIILGNNPKNLVSLSAYFKKFYDYCFEIPLKSVLKSISKFI